MPEAQDHGEQRSAHENEGAGEPAGPAAATPRPLPAARTTPWRSAGGWPPRRSRPDERTGDGGGTGDIDVDVAVIGAGIVGLTTAVLLAGRGCRVAVLEDRHVAAGTSGYTTAKVTALHGTRYQELRRLHGADVAARYASANVDALAWIRERCEGTGQGDGDTSWEAADAYTYAGRADQRATVEHEAEAAAGAGLAAELVDDVDLPFPTFGAVRVADQGQLDPVAFLTALAASATAEGAAVLEGTRATAVQAGPGGLVVRTGDGGGEVRAGWVVVSTGLPFLDRALLFARAEAHTSYAVAARVTGALPEGMFITAGTPTRSVRTAPDPDRPGERLLLLGGAGHKTGHIQGSTIERYRELVAFGAPFGVPSGAQSGAPSGAPSGVPSGVEVVTHRWSAEDYSSVDALPFVGPSRLLPGNVLVATGFGKWGMTTGVAAARVLADQVDGAEPPAWAADWDPRRLRPASVPALARMNLDVAAHLAGGWAGTVRGRGRGRGGGRPVAGGYGRTAVGRRGAVATASSAGVTRSVSAVCTHLGGIVAWNDGDGCWDCPLHGSRFDHDGTLLHGPATRDLRPISDAEADADAEG